ncbi:hypothetical protein BHU72_14350 [Desulfuribacillus stibiiarsenatis]|uniref:C-type cytochrome biogenesis protein CcmI n=1 Tax=Desulfuribacillus stibiiarsenatis TaxID=1390249 RepID=A0A1E5L7G4_9FIRM|nr:hypothetical protein [Desulfuribacillus stibiiarsenatis]OEH86102.1 hypothetical protein BHU72_14350 [Desulfuribacillus stibiiarsenatis]
MELGIVLVGSGILLMVSFYWIVKPLRTYEEARTEVINERDAKEAIFSTLNEIEFDYQTKKISEEDYQALKQDYEVEAMLLLKQEESETKHFEVNQELEEEIEKEIERELEQEIEAELDKRRKGK